ncbi:reverse transcriptase domain-containing protein [Tanacetum coccineum]
MAPNKRTTRASPATTTTTTTPVTNPQLKVLIDQGIADALAARDANRSMNGDDSYNSGIVGTEGVVELTQWFERMETVFHISNCTVENQIKFSTCTLLGSALTWWNAHVRTVGHDVAYAMTWTNLKKMMTHKYCPRGEIKKLGVEMWTLKVKVTDVVGYNQQFQELALMCARMFHEESDKIEKYKISTFAEHQAENKRKLDNNNQAQQQPSKKQGVAITYTAGSGERKESPAATNNQINLTCHECGNQGHYKRGGETNQDLNNMEDDIDA